MQNVRYARAQALYVQHRFELALEELTGYHAEHPDAADGHYLAAACLWRLDRLEDATERARAAIASSPEWARPYCLLARILKERFRYGEAKVAIDEALRLDPEDADHYFALSLIHIRRGEYEPALAAAEQGLEVGPNSDSCHSARALALSLLGRSHEGLAESSLALETNPNDPFGHACRGWVMYNAHRPKDARKCFLEALRLKPDYEWARQGLVYAMMRQIAVAREVLGTYHWLRRLPAWFRIPLSALIVPPLIILFFLGCVMAPAVMAGLVGATVWAFYTRRALGLLALRFDRVGRSVLTPDELSSARWCGWLGGAGWLLVAISQARDNIALLAGMFLLAWVRPLTDVFSCESGRSRRTMAAYAGVLAFLGGAAIVGAFLNRAPHSMTGQLVVLFVVGAVAAPFVSGKLRRWRQST